MAVGLLDEMLEGCILPFESALNDWEASPVTSDRVAELVAAATVMTDMLHVLHKKLKGEVSASARNRIGGSVAIACLVCKKNLFS